VITSLHDGSLSGGSRVGEGGLGDEGDAGAHRAGEVRDSEAH
jgi:hypothetical protein